MQQPAKQAATGKEHSTRPLRPVFPYETKAERRLNEITAQAMEGFEKWVKVFKAEVASDQ